MSADLSTVAGEAERGKPRLLVLASTYPRWRGDPEPGFVHELSRRLAAHFRVTVVTPDSPGAEPSGVLEGVRVVRYRYAPRHLQTLVYDGGILANLRRRPWKWLLLPSFLLGMLRETRAACRAGEPDLIHAHWLVPQGAIAALVSAMGRRGPSRFVVTSHGADLHALGGRSMTALKRFAARRAAAITVVSSAMLARVDALGVQPARLEVMPMGVDFDLFAPDSRVTRSASELLFVGRLVEKKGVRYLLDAMPRLLDASPGLRLKIVGFGPEEAALRQQVDRLDIGRNVEFLGAVPQQELPRLYQSATALVAPFVAASDGDQEGLGLVVVEALACGCPVVTTEIPAVREIFGGERPAFCARPGSPESLASEIIRLLSDVAGARAGVAAALPVLRRRFGWDSVAAGYARLLYQVMFDEDRQA